MPLSRVQPGHYQSLLQAKVRSVCQMLAPFSPPEPRVYPSQPTGFRMRAEFRVWHDGDDLNYVMFRPEAPAVPVVVSEFPIAHPRIQELMWQLMAHLKRDLELRRRLFQIEFMASLSGEALVTLVYHRKLEPAWEIAARSLLEELSTAPHNVSLIGRSRRQKLVMGTDYITEVLQVRGQEYTYRQYEQSFSQPNGRVNISMIEWSCEQAGRLSGDLLELYCGNGNFTLPLSRQFEQVVATEVAKAGIRAARINVANNNIGNVHVLRMSAEEVAQALNGERSFRRLRELPKPLDQFRLDTLFVDPPRAGLDARSSAVARRFTNVLYISCNPVSLARDLGALNETHRITHFALFDQFPYTDHMECGVMLEARTAP